MDSATIQLNRTKNVGFGKLISKNKKYNDDDESDELCNTDSSDYCDSIKSKSMNSMKNKNDNGRLPTRRPDPNVFNRNALMARENRRKKKEYTEMLEQDVEKHKKVNKKLHKLLKRQQNYIEALKNERNYFKSILTNKTEILSLVNLVRTATVSPKSDYQFKIGKTESSLSPNSSPQQLESSSYSPNSSPQQFESSSYSTANSNDYNNDYSLSLNECRNSWDDLLQDINMNPLNTTQFDYDSLEDKSSIIQDEHSYFKAEEEDANDSGVCLHISNGKLSLEFCAECHENSKKPFIEEF